MNSRVIVVATVAILAVSALAGAVVVFTGDDGRTTAEFRFANVSEEAGFNYSATAPNSVGNGNEGVYVLDYNNDNWSDLLVTGGAEPVLFENVNGEFRRTGALPEVGHVQSVLTFDRGGDGWTDVLLLPRHGNATYLENEEGTFAERDVGLDADLGVAVGATTADYDGDGRLDLFIFQYGDWATSTPAGWNVEGELSSDNGARNLLYRGTADGFERVNTSVTDAGRWTLAASFVDFTGNGRPDIHVANDFNYDFLYVNTGDGFEPRRLPDATNRNGMSSEVADVNGDGRMDLFVSNIYLPISEANVSEERYRLFEQYQSFVLGKRTKGNTLLINQGNGTFVDRARDYGVRRGGWAWAASLTDFDADGDRDLFTTTQTVIQIDEENPTYTYPMVWQRGEEKFDRLNASGIGFEETNGRGTATLDFDRDGDRDIVLANNDERFVLYENRIEGGNSLTVAVRSGDGAQNLGARVTATVDGENRVAALNARADYQSQDDRLVFVGIGDSETVDSVQVQWPDGTVRKVESVAAGGRLTVWKNGTLNRESYPG